MAMRMNTNTFIIALVVLIIAAGTFVLLVGQRAPSISNFVECAAAGYPIMESYPEQCSAPDGRTFVREVPPTSEDSGKGSQDLGLQTNGCAVAGCSGQLCVSAADAGGMMSTCEYRAEYACYKQASCQPQADGTCGWTQTAELQRCLKSPPPLDVDAGAGVEVVQ